MTSQQDVINRLCARIELELRINGHEQTGRVIIQMDNRTLLIRDFHPGSEGDTIPKLLGMLKLLNDQSKEQDKTSERRVERK